MTLNDTIAFRIRQSRNSLNITQQQLADEFNLRFDSSINRGMVSKWESGKEIPNTHHLIQLSQFFNLSLDYMVGNIEVRSYREIPFIEYPELSHNRFIYKVICFVPESRSADEHNYFYMQHNEIFNDIAQFDRLLFRKQDTATNNQLIAVFVNGEFMIRYYYAKNNIVSLRSDSEHTLCHVKDICIVGACVEIVKFLDTNSSL